MANLLENPIIYHLIVDRFFSAGLTEFMQNQPEGMTNSGVFFGGKFSGVTQKINEGWFSDLGVNAILISAPYEQIKGWVPSAGGVFKHYGYHGYYALDYTIVDSRLGTDDDLRSLVDRAHKKGISIIIDIVMNHPGYADLQTLHELGISAVRENWGSATPDDYWRYLNLDSDALLSWWGPDWVRCDLPGYPRGGNDNYTMLLHGLPDFRTESESPVALPEFLRKKLDTRARSRHGFTVRDYLIHWLTIWVKEYGIDGFRCDSVRHVEPDAWSELKSQAVEARASWLKEHSKKSVDKDGFWMLGEVFDHGIERDGYYDIGFDALINFNFQRELESESLIDAIYDDYSARIQNDRKAQFISYISSHDTHLCDRKKLKDRATHLMLAPGGILMLYGDEIGRQPGPTIEEDPAQATRSPMNWGVIDSDLLMHWRKLGGFRARHISIARGVHLKLAECPYAFARVDIDGDRVVVAICSDEYVILPVGGIFNEGENVRDAYTGRVGVVEGDHVRICAEGVVLLERVNVAM